MLIGQILSSSGESWNGDNGGMMIKNPGRIIQDGIRHSIGLPFLIMEWYSRPRASSSDAERISRQFGCLLASLEEQRMLLEETEDLVCGLKRELSPEH